MSRICAIYAKKYLHNISKASHSMYLSCMLRQLIAFTDGYETENNL